MTVSDQAPRKAWMSVLATAAAADLAALWETFDGGIAHEALRPAEIGSAMVRGRAGATGAAFNLGEMTVTRCSVQLEDGTVGHAYIQGRDKTKATQAALVDALMQTANAAKVEAKILGPLRQAAEARRAARAARAAATKVDFFTMARGED